MFKPLLSFSLLSLFAAVTFAACDGGGTPPATPASPAAGDSAAPDGGADNGGLTVQFAEAEAVIKQRCTACHATSPEITRFGRPAGGILLETPEQMKALSSRIRARAVRSEGMPTANLTNMTREERDLLGRWVEAGAPIE